MCLLSLEFYIRTSWKDGVFGEGSKKVGAGGL